MQPWRQQLAVFPLTIALLFLLQFNPLAAAAAPPDPTPLERFFLTLLALPPDQRENFLLQHWRSEPQLLIESYALLQMSHLPDSWTPAGRELAQGRIRALNLEALRNVTVQTYFAARDVELSNLFPRNAQFFAEAMGLQDPQLQPARTTFEALRVPLFFQALLVGPRTSTELRLHLAQRLRSNDRPILILSHSLLRALLQTQPMLGLPGNQPAKQGATQLVFVAVDPATIATPEQALGAWFGQEVRMSGETFPGSMAQFMDGLGGDLLRTVRILMVPDDKIVSAGGQTSSVTFTTNQPGIAREYGLIDVPAPLFVAVWREIVEAAKWREPTVNQQALLNATANNHWPETTTAEGLERRVAQLTGRGDADAAKARDQFTGEVRAIRDLGLYLRSTILLCRDPESAANQLAAADGMRATLDFDRFREALNGLWTNNSPDNTPLLRLTLFLAEFLTSKEGAHLYPYFAEAGGFSEHQLHFFLELARLSTANSDRTNRIKAWQEALGVRHTQNPHLPANWLRFFSAHFNPSAAVPPPGFQLYELPYMAAGLIAERAGETHFFANADERTEWLRNLRQALEIPELPWRFVLRENFDTLSDSSVTASQRLEALGFIRRRVMQGQAVEIFRRAKDPETKYLAAQMLLTILGDQLEPARQAAESQIHLLLNDWRHATDWFLEARHWDLIKAILEIVAYGAQDEVGTPESRARSAGILNAAKRLGLVEKFGVEPSGRDCENTFAKYMELLEAHLRSAEIADQPTSSGQRRKITAVLVHQLVEIAYLPWMSHQRSTLFARLESLGLNPRMLLSLAARQDSFSQATTARLLVQLDAEGRTFGRLTPELARTIDVEALASMREGGILRPEFVQHRYGLSPRSDSPAPYNREAATRPRR